MILCANAGCPIKIAILDTINLRYVLLAKLFVTHNFKQFKKKHLKKNGY